MGRDEMRAGDTDRQAVADKLKQALDEGRLDLGEYDERLQKAYAAKTYGDLNGLLDDLPGATVTARPQPVAHPAVPHPAPPVPSSRSGQLVRAWFGGFGGVFLVCTTIWLITSLSSGHLQYFWPVWLLIPTLLGLFGRLGDHNDGHRGRRDGRHPRDRRDRR
ncbi:DUF1707 domain-containing protein [Actinophytocola sp.]|uniref:DUF1707 SHOCT-like domain-containing protein n=1 Tax=Actinophytocola sp. TaxID=1872138 RepID=UPI00389AD487